MGSDEINSIGDTAEAQQIVNIIETVYYNMAARAELPEHQGLFQLQGFDNPFKPVLMTVPDNVTKIEWIRYFDSNPSDGSTLGDTQFGAFSHDLNTDLQNNSTFAMSFPWTTVSTTTVTVGLGNITFSVPASLTLKLGDQCEILNGSTLYMSGTVAAYANTSLTIKVTSISGSGTFSSWTINQINAPSTAPGYRIVQPLDNESFVMMVSRFNPQDSDVLSFRFTEMGQNFIFNYKNDRFPCYYTVFSNQYVIFDSFDNTQDSTLNGTKNMCWGWTIPAFLLQDNFIPNLNDYQFPLLISEVKELAFLELKQMAHPKAAQESRRQWSNLQKNKSVTNKPTYFQQLPDFGRRLYTGGYSTGFPYDFTQGYNGAPY